MKVIWQASLPENCKQANQCNNSLESEEVYEKKPAGHTHYTHVPNPHSQTECFLLNQGQIIKHFEIQYIA